MWEPAISGMGNTHNCAPKLQAYPPIFSLTPKASGSTRLQSCEDKVFNSLKKWTFFCPFNKGSVLDFQGAAFFVAS